MISLLATSSLYWMICSILSLLVLAAFIHGARKTGSNEVSPNAKGLILSYYTVAPALLCIAIYALSAGPVLSTLIKSELPSGFSGLSGLQVDDFIERAMEEARSGRPLDPETLFGAVSLRLQSLIGQARVILFLAMMAAGAAGFLYGLSRQKGRSPRVSTDDAAGSVLFVFALFGLAATIAIVVTLAVDAVRFFGLVSPADFFFSLDWNVQSGAAFGAAPLFFGTLYVAFIALLIAAPVGLMVAVYLSEYARPERRVFLKSVLEILAGIPTVVYGFFALTIIAPLVRNAALWINQLLSLSPVTDQIALSAQPTNILAAGIVMGIMIIPYVSSLTDDVMSATPPPLRQAALALGATHSETVRQVVLPAAFPGLAAALLLAVSRAVGETMIVVMAAGQLARITLDPTSDMTTVTVQIVEMLVGDANFDSPQALSAFALGLMLFGVTLIFNLIALRVVDRYRQNHA